MKVHLTDKKCVACEGGVPPLTKTEAEGFLAETSGWILNAEAIGISKNFKFKNFIEAMRFVNKVAELAEREGHHPDIHINYNKVLLELTTHAKKGLSENDFIVAAKVNALIL